MKRLKPKWRALASAQSEAMRILPRFAKAYLRAGAKAARHETAEDKLHQFRLVTKDFRYLLESFQPLYGKKLNPYFDKLKHIQKLLGELNDYAVTRQMMAEERGADRDLLLKYLDKQQKQKLKGFVKYWHSNFGSEEQQSNWASGLKTVE